MKPQVNKTNNQSYKQATPYVMQGNRRRKTAIIIAGRTEHMHIEAQSAKHQPQDTNLMPLLTIKNVVVLIFAPANDGVG